MSSNNTPDGKPPKKPAKAKTSKPRTSKDKSTAPIDPVQPDAGIPTSANSPNLVHGSGQWNGELNTEVCSTMEADSQKSVPDSQVETQHTPKEQTITRDDPDSVPGRQPTKDSLDLKKTPGSSQSPHPEPTTDEKNSGDNIPSETPLNKSTAPILPHERKKKALTILTDQGAEEQTPTQSSTQPDPTEDAKNTGDVADPVLSADGIPGEKSVESLSSRVSRLPGEGRSACHERLRRLARSAGMPRGQGPGTAYNWAFEQTDMLFTKLAEDNSQPPVIVEELPDDSELKPAEPTSDAPPAEVVSQKTVEETARAAPAADLGVSGLGEIPESWPSLPANAQLQVEIAWVSANRLRVRSGSGVDLSRALSPAPSYSALSWLETSILFPSKFADISVKATADQDDEKEHIKREKLAIEEIRSILKEMLDAKS